jgi:hypothetical protein
MNLPDGKYLISVLADGYKLDGVHFNVPLESPGIVTVELQPTPLPTATIQAEIFEDISPTNSGPDVPAERGLAGFVGHIADYIGEVTTNVFGDPLCGPGGCVSQCYVVSGGLDIGTVNPVDADGRCPIGFTTADDPLLAADITQTREGDPIPAGAAIEGKLKIPDVGPNRYALAAIPPDGSTWIQTTTLEGNHDWDAWVMEGATGLDTEFVVAGEPFPAIFFGYVQPVNKLTTSAAGVIKGVVADTAVYVPAKGGLALGGNIFGGLGGGKIAKVIENPWVSLVDLNSGDTAVYIGQGDANGAFTINNVPDGDYTLAYWDEPQDYILNLFNVTLRNGEPIDLGVIPLNGWWTSLYGHVFNDLNANGKMDPGEPGMSNFPVVMRKRENSVMDRGAVLVNTDADGYYFMENAYPMTQWLVQEVYSDLYYTTGITYQADNQPTETTVLGQGVDVNVLPIIGLKGRLDWGVRAYDKGTNGGIVGTVSYDTTRNELDPRYAAVEDWQPGVPNLTVNLWASVPCPKNADGSIVAGNVCDPSKSFLLASDGSYAKGNLLNVYTTETWERPTNCVARDVNGNPLVHGVDENVLPLDPNADCLEGPLMGVQFGPNAADGNFGAAVNGNYGFGDGCFGPGGFDVKTGACVDGSDPVSLTPADYLVEVVVPNDALGRPMYQFTKEEDINIFNGDEFIPQVPPPACVGPLHTVDVAGVGTDGYPAVVLANGVAVAASTPVDNQPYADAGGSYYEGQARPLCDMKLVHLSDRRSIAPTFNVFTDVPLPGRFWGLIVDDLNFSSNPQSLLYGEKAGVPFAPVGIYDYTNRLVTTVESDFNGLFDVLLPSSNRISCPTPSGVCANLYRFVGNDPGVPGHLNLNYKPQFRTIAAEFEAIPGLIVPADLAPTQVGVTVQLPGGQFNQVMCMVNDPFTVTDATAVPEFYTINQPYMRTNATGSTRNFTIYGKYFGAQQGSGSVKLGATTASIISWTDTQIRFTVPTGVPTGTNQLQVTSANGKSTINSLTFQVLPSNTSNNRVYEVGPGKAFASIQTALDAAAAFKGTANNRHAWVVVYPNTPSVRVNPRGAYFENLIITAPVVLQGVGPGSPDGSVAGSIIDGSAFGGDTALADAWRAKMDGLFVTLPDGTDVPTWLGNSTIAEGQVIYILAFSTNQYKNNDNVSIDGLDIRGGDQMGFPNNINVIGGGPTGLPANVQTQGGAIFANAYVNYLQITNNVIEGNGGAYGTVRIGTPNLPDEQNDNVRIAYNRIIANAGTNLAGGIGLFAGSQAYEVAFNDICGNFSAEYGGGISHYGFSPKGSIHDNRIYFNSSYDEGGGIMIAGQLPADPTALSPGSGEVDIYNNLVQANLSNDDGGGIRFLMVGRHNINVYNNMIVNNISTHEGGGISLNDAPTVRIYNNTIMKNLTTATALTSTGIPAPAGLSTSVNSDQLQATLPGGWPLFSDPLLFNNIFWDNRAGLRSADGVFGLGIANTGPINNWDMGVAGTSFLLSPSNSILQTTLGTVASATNKVGQDPLVVSQYDASVTFQAWRTNPNFVGAILVAADLPPYLLGNYHLQSGSPAIDAGAASKNGVSAPAFDIDNQPRPISAYDIGADETVRPQPSLPVLDNFNRADSNNLGSNWSQANSGSSVDLRVNSNQAFANQTNDGGQAVWNAAVFGANQGAAFTFGNNLVNNAALILKASGGTTVAPANFIRVRYQSTGGTSVLVQTTTNGGSSYTTRGTLTGVTFASGDTLSAMVYADGTVLVYKNGTFIGSVVTSASGAWTLGTGRIGIQLQSNGVRVDNFSGGSLP